MVRVLYSLFSIALFLSFAGCDQVTLMKKMTPAEDESFARRHVDLLRQQQFEQIERELDSSISSPNTRGTLAGMAALFPAEVPKSIKVVGVKFFRFSGSSTDSITLEYEFAEKWLLVNMSIKRTDDVLTITGFNVTPIADSLENINRFSLIGKSPLQYAVLGLAIVGPVFCLYLFVICIRSKREKHRWLWAIFILFGVGRLAVNWTTGEWTVTPLAIHVPCAEATAAPYGPWVVAISLPLGAILFILVKRRRRVALAELQPSSVGDLPPTASE
jgi:hypothetical protein